MADVDRFVDQQRKRIDLAEELDAKYPHSLAGVWQDEAHQTHVSATDPFVLDYAKSRLPYIHTHVVEHSREELEEVQDQVKDYLTQLNAGDGSFVGINEKTNKVTVSLVSSTDSRLDHSRFETALSEVEQSAANQLEDKFDAVEMVKPEPTVNYAGCENGWDCFPYLRGGMYIQVGNKGCTVGFAARNRKGEKHILTAGHCGGNGSIVKTGLRQNTPVGILTNSSNNVATDSARIFVSDPAWKLTRWVRMDPSRQAVKILGKLGQYAAGDTVVCKSGMATHLTCGKVTKSNYSIRVGNVWHEGFWQASFRSSEGDSGGPVFVPYNARKNASKAYGIVSGYQGNTHTVGPGIFNVERSQNVTIVTD